MDIREFSPKALPYHFVLFYDLSPQQMQMYAGIFGGTLFDNALLTYCYIDRMAGISFDVICCALVNHKDGSVKYHMPDRRETSMKIREGGLESNAIIVDGDPYIRFLKYWEDEIKRYYGYHQELISINPDIPFDNLRHPMYPDDVFVFFFDQAGRVERMWVREVSRENGTIVGILLDEPFNRDLFLHKGDVVQIEAYVREEDGAVMPIWRR